ncbi:hypothetical protein BGU93_19180, partial [Clostridioides difficile]
RPPTVRQGSVAIASLCMWLSVVNFRRLSVCVSLLGLCASGFALLPRWRLVQGREDNLTQGPTRLDFF